MGEGLRIYTFGNMPFAPIVLSSLVRLLILCGGQDGHLRFSSGTLGVLGRLCSPGRHLHLVLISGQGLWSRPDSCLSFIHTILPGKVGRLGSKARRGVSNGRDLHPTVFHVYDNAYHKRIITNWPGRSWHTDNT